MKTQTTYRIVAAAWAVVIGWSAPGLVRQPADRPPGEPARAAAHDAGVDASAAGLIDLVSVAAAAAPAGGGDEVTLSDLETYIRLRQEIERTDPVLAAAVRRGDVSGMQGRLEAVLAGSPMDVGEFLRVQRQVQSRPEVSAAVESRIAAAEALRRAPGISGAPGAAERRLPGWASPLPSGPALGTGPSTLVDRLPPNTKKPALGAGAPAPTDPAGDREPGFGRRAD